MVRAMTRWCRSQRKRIVNLWLPEIYKTQVCEEYHNDQNLFLPCIQFVPKYYLYISCELFPIFLSLSKFVSPLNNIIIKSIYHQLKTVQLPIHLVDEFSKDPFGVIRVTLVHWVVNAVALFERRPFRSHSELHFKFLFFYYFFGYLCLLTSSESQKHIIGKRFSPTRNQCCYCCCRFIKPKIYRQHATLVAD